MVTGNCWQNIKNFSSIGKINFIVIIYFSLITLKLQSNISCFDSILTKQFSDYNLGYI